jgi:hypothetical protein
MITAKQEEALARGRDIRAARCVLALLTYLRSKYPQPFAGSGAIQDAILFAKLFHNRQFGKAKCKECKIEELDNPLSVLCLKCSKEVMV